ncbi:MAG: SPOR domain-containing protein, partial [Geminicoccaceae bacterium]
FIQIGAFAEPERAARLAHRLNARSVAAADHYTRVRIGPIADGAAAAAALDRIKRNGYPGAFMVPAGAGGGSAC